MENRDLSREPCPDRIVEDLGGAFGMGCVGGFLWHFAKGWRHSPTGDKLTGGLYSARLRAPILGGNFAVWGGTFSSFDCAFQYMRQKDDHWNAIASGACSGGVLALRGGWRAASRQAAIGGVLLAVIETVMIVFSRKSVQTPRTQYYQAVEMEKKMQDWNNKKSAGTDTAAAGSGWPNLNFFSGTTSSSGDAPSDGKSAASHSHTGGAETDLTDAAYNNPTQRSTPFAHVFS